MNAFYLWRCGDAVAVDYDGAKVGKAYPGYLDELRWETDFFLKIEYPDGSGRVSHKLTLHA